MTKRSWLLAMGCFVMFTGSSSAAPPGLAQVDVPVIPALEAPADPVQVLTPPVALPVPLPVPQLPPALPQVAVPQPAVPRIVAPSSPRPVAESPLPRPTAPSPAPGEPAGSSHAAPVAAPDESRASTREPVAVRVGERKRRARADRRLRRAVRRLTPCLSSLPRIQARVLALRAGIGPGRAMSRGRVARALDRPQRLVRRLERRGLANLRQARDGGACTRSVEPDGAGATPAIAAAGGGEVVRIASDAAPAQLVGDSGGSGDRGGVLGEQREGGRRTIAGVIPRPPAPIELTLPLIIALCSIAWLVGRRLHRARG